MIPTQLVLHMIRLLEEGGFGKLLKQALGLLMQVSSLRVRGILVHDC